MADLVTGQVGPQAYVDNVIPGAGLRMGRAGDLIISELHGRFFEQSSRGNLYMAQAIVTAPVIYSTAAGTGGPLLWNGSSTVKASILAIGWGVSTVSTVGAAIGLTGNSGQTSAPASTTAIDGVKNCLIGGGAPACTAYRIGTPTSAGGFLMPFGDLNTGALTTTPGGFHWVEIGGLFTVPQYGWVSVAASATASTTVMTVGLIWEEIPN